MSDEQPPEVAPPVDEVEPRGAREILIDRYMEAVRDELLAAGYLSPTAVREREAAAWDACAVAVSARSDEGNEFGPQSHLLLLRMLRQVMASNPFKGGAS